MSPVPVLLAAWYLLWWVGILGARPGQLRFLPLGSTHGSRMVTRPRPALPVTLPSIVGTNLLGLGCGWSELTFLIQSCQELNS